MSTFLLGTNRFEECETLITHRGVMLLRIDIGESGMMLNLRMPDGAKPLVIEQNQVTEGEAHVVVTAPMVSVVKDETLLIHAAQVEDDLVLVNLDLRPLRTAIHTDADGLHVGQSVLAGNVVQGKRVAITLD